MAPRTLARVILMLVITWPIYVLLLAPPSATPAPPQLPPPPGASAPASAAPTSSATHEAPTMDPNGGPAAAATTSPTIQPAQMGPAEADAAVGEHTRQWRPPTDLVHVPFPLEGERRAPTEIRYRAPIVDLRDPFVHGRYSDKPLPAELRAKLLPDLKDPFILPRPSRPKGWAVALPGDIRDPFAERVYYRSNCKAAVAATADGVTIQRPSAIKADDPEKCTRAPIRTLPADLMDPFAR